MDINTENMIAFGVENNAIELTELIKNNLAAYDLSSPQEMKSAWQSTVKNIFSSDIFNALNPEVKDKLAYHLYDKVIYANWDNKQLGTPPTYVPDLKKISTSNEVILAQKLGIDTQKLISEGKPEKIQEELYNASITPEKQREFYVGVLKIMGFDNSSLFKNDFKLDEENLVNVKDPQDHQWLVGAKMNIADFMLHHPSPETAMLKYQREGEEIAEYSYEQVNKLSNKVANGLISQGFKQGDTILASMPMSADSEIMYMGAIKAGIKIVNIPDSSIDAMIGEYEGKINGIYTQDFHVGGKGHPIYEKVINSELVKNNDIQVIVRGRYGNEIDNKRDGDISLKTLTERQSEEFESISLNPHDTVLVHASSGTTGKSKMIAWDSLTFIRSAMDAMLNFDIKQNSVNTWLTSNEWMMSSHERTANFLNNATMALFEGNIKSNDFTRFIENIESFGQTPGHAKGILGSNSLEGADLSKMTNIKNTGGKSNAINIFKMQLRSGFSKAIEYCGGTEIGGGYISNSMLKPSAMSEFDTFCYGHDVMIMDKEIANPKDEVEPFFEKGEMAIVMAKKDKNGKDLGFIPPLGISQKLLNRSFTHEDKYPLVELADENNNVLSLRKHGDGLTRLPNGNIRSDGRIDNYINIGGIKKSYTELEETIENAIQKNKSSVILQDIEDFAVYGVPSPDGEEKKLIAHIQFRDPDKHRDKEKIKAVIGAALANNHFSFKRAVVDVVKENVQRTKSNKKMHKSMIKNFIKNHYERFTDELGKTSEKSK